MQLNLEANKAEYEFLKRTSLYDAALNAFLHGNGTHSFVDGHVKITVEVTPIEK